MQRKSPTRMAMLMSIFAFCALYSWSIALSEGPNDIIKLPECKYCGMNRKHFAHSRMVVNHKDGTSVGTCSINCTASDYIKALDDSPISLQVGDYLTHKLIDAHRAYWVIGGNVRGVMTENAKWAFEKKTDAEAFIKTNGGKNATFDEVMKASYEDIYEEMRTLKKMKLEYLRSKRSSSPGIGIN